MWKHTENGRKKVCGFLGGVPSYIPNYGVGAGAVSTGNLPPPPTPPEVNQGGFAPSNFGAEGASEVEASIIEVRAPEDPDSYGSPAAAPEAPEAPVSDPDTYGSPAAAPVGTDAAAPAAPVSDEYGAAEAAPAPSSYDAAPAVNSAAEAAPAQYNPFIRRTKKKRKIHKN